MNDKYERRGGPLGVLAVVIAIANFTYSSYFSKHIPKDDAWEYAVLYFGYLVYFMVGLVVAWMLYYRKKE
jgi:hypothetical protein